MSRRIPESVINEISSKVNIQEVVSRYVTLTSRGGRLIGLCPFHTEKTPSFSVSPDKNAFYCFGCGKGGGLFQFVMEIENISFIEAVRMLADKAGIDIPEEDGSPGPDRKTREAKLELYTRVAASFHHILSQTETGAKAREYLKTRGINPETAEKFQLGLAPPDPEWLYRFLLKKNYTPEFLAESGLFSKKNDRYPLFVNRLMFPVFNNAGQVVGFSGRDLGDHGPKYINSPETDIYHKGSLLYGYFQASKEIRKLKQAILCEGNVDVLALHQAGLIHTAAPLGTAFTEDQARLLARSAAKVIIAFDSDNAGRKATEKCGMICEKAGLEILVAEFPSGKDPAELLQSEGGEILQKQVLRAVNFFDFLLKYKFDSHGGHADKKGEVVSGVAPYIASVSSVIRRDMLLEKTADFLGLDRTAVRQEFLNFDKGTPSRFGKKDDPSTKSEDRISQELYLMMCAVHQRSAFAEIREAYSEADFADSRAQELYRVLCRADDDRIDDLDVILRSIEDEELKRILLRKMHSEEFRINNEAVIAESIRSIRYQKLLSRSGDLKVLMTRMESQGASSEELLELIEEKNLIDKEIHKLKDVRK